MRSAILCVDDDKTVLNSLRALLSMQCNPREYLIEIAESGEEALELQEEFQKEGIDLKLVISDYIMPAMKGDELLIEMHQNDSKMVKVMLTGQSSINGVVNAINNADLYRFIQKPWDDNDLVVTVKKGLKSYDQDTLLEKQNAELKALNEILEARVIARTKELEEKNRQLEEISITDPLTGLYNRFKIDDTLDNELHRTHRFHRPFSVILADVDHFKSVNDNFGHQVGDKILIDIARLLKEHTRDTDMVGRWGGEEFMIICPETDDSGAYNLAELIRLKIEAFEFDVVHSKTTSFGVATSRVEDTIESLIERADKALYRAKNGGRNKVEC